MEGDAVSECVDYMANLKFANDLLKAFGIYSDTVTGFKFTWDVNGLGVIEVTRLITDDECNEMKNVLDRYKITAEHAPQSERTEMPVD